MSTFNGPVSKGVSQKDVGVTRTDSPPKTKDEFKWVSLRLITQMATRIESKGIRVEFFIVRDGPVSNESTTKPEIQMRSAAYQMLAKILVPFGIK